MKYCKYIALAMATVLLLLCINVNIFAYTDIEHSESMDKIVVLDELGLYTGYQDGTFRPNETVTRLEFCETMVNIMNIDVSAYYNSQSPFSDVPTGHWAAPFVIALYNQGFINGTGNGEFRPYENVSVTDVLKTFIHILGADFLAEQNGGYPLGYETVAVDFGITKGIKSINSELTRETFATLIYNLLEQPVYEMSSFGEYRVIYDSDRYNFMSKYLNLYKGKGIVYESENISLVKEGQKNSEYIKIGDLSLLSSEKSVDDYIGQYTEYYARLNDNDEYELVAIFPVKTDVVKLYPDDIVSVNMKSSKEIEIKYSKENEIKYSTVEITQDATVVYNGVRHTNFDPDVDFNIMCGEITLIDNDRSGKYSVVLINEYDIIVAGGIYYESGLISDVYDTSKRIMFNDANVKYTFERDGKEFDPNDIVPYDILCVEKNKYNMTNVNVLVSRNRIAGNITMVNNEGVYIDDKFYKLTGVASTLNLVPGDHGAFYADIYGKIAAYDKKYDFNTNVYALMMAASKNSGIDETYAYKFMLQDKTICILSSKDKIIINGTKSFASEVVDNKDFYLNNVVIITTDAERKTLKGIKTFNPGIDRSSVYNGISGQEPEFTILTDRYSLAPVKEDGTVNNEAIGDFAELTYRANNRSMIEAGTINKSHVFMDISTPIFIVPQNAEAYGNEDYYDVVTYTFFSNSGTYNVKAYGDERNIYPDYVICQTDSGNSINDSSDMVLVDRVTSNIIDDEDCMILYGYRKGKAVTYACYNNAISALNKGDVVRIKTNSRAAIESVTVDFDAAKWENNTRYSGRYDSAIEIICGRIVKLQDLNIALVDTSKTMAGDLRGVDFTYANTYYYTCYKDRIAKTSDKGDIALGDLVLVRSRSSRVLEVFIFKE